GQQPGPHFPDVEALRVPIFMIPGNHDYRKHAYDLVFDLGVGQFDVRRINNYDPYRLSHADALALERGDSLPFVPNKSTSSAARMIEVDQGNYAYATHLADRRNYVVRLGPHCITMLDSGWDTGMMTDWVDGLRLKLGQTSE